ncbi:hypothetical protein PR048_006799 [Dryococelus australis]|uniref:PiggyBac transposable element-derived protein domain-containing protein n=1 Tax=Dryococelus australis TaxID=614101 RepID=A0ABQ9ID75_9NEOP|nr:hypothetical protein PR048_006799 [Dryococelus australis]
MLEVFRDQCSFYLYIANKPAKYGIKTYALQSDDPYKVGNAASSVVKHVAAPILKTGKNTTMDYYFTSITVVKELLEQKTTIVGTPEQERNLPTGFGHGNHISLQQHVWIF